MRVRTRTGLCGAVLSLSILASACGSVPVCGPTVGEGVTRECLENELRAGDQVQFVTIDGASHRGHFAGIDTTDSMYAMGFSEDVYRTGRLPEYTTMPLSEIDSISRSRRLPGALFGIAFFAPVALLLLLAAAWS